MAEGRGSCFASDMITSGRHRVGFMYREPPDDAGDSGWRFLSGLEDDAYMEDPANIGLHDVNTIANYDPAIIAFLDAPVGAAFERPSADRPLQPAADWAAPGED
jgi:hypothetical protein